MPLNLTKEYLQSQRLTEDAYDRFIEKVFHLTYDGGCHIWMGAIIGNVGYGKLKRGLPFRGDICAHIASWLFHKGPIPKGLLVCHNCPGGDNRLCVNPSHLWIGTPADNTRDMCLKGMSTFGERCVHAKLTWEKVYEIRSLCASGVKRSVVASMFGVKVFCIHKIVTGQRWNQCNFSD